MRRNNHYEAAFEHLLRTRGLPYVPVDEARRALFASADLKSFDFVVYLPDRRNLLIDVKGRRARHGPRGWQYDCWVSRGDLDALATWQEVFGRDFAAALVFAFHLADPDAVGLFEPFAFRNRHYRFYAAYLDDYRPYVKPRSASWDTVTIPRKVFKEIAFDFNEFGNSLTPQPEPPDDAP